MYLVLQDGRAAESAAAPARSDLGNLVGQYSGGRCGAGCEGEVIVKQVVIGEQVSSAEQC